jgi:hypothetical protein
MISSGEARPGIVETCLDAQAKGEAHVWDGTKTAGKTWPGEVAQVLRKHTWLLFPQYALLINNQVGLEY